jgi:Zn-dependent protease|uniref:Site-2 protease family protein n=1 Tax=candidate division WOR-3 bacterium TaxID=2052148 RepID=A0A7C3UWJ7_UNCW3
MDRNLLLSLPGILFGLTFHEYAHGFVALKLGDPTAKFSGRLTLNPLKHIDPLGLISAILFRIGWAKPVPIDPFNFSDRKKGLLLVSLSGPGANLFLAFLSGILARLTINFSSFLYQLFHFSVIYNLIFAFFNLIPIPPLDGSKVLSYILPEEAAFYYMELERYGFYFIFLIIIISNLLGIPILFYLINPLVSLFYRLFAG